MADAASLISMAAALEDPAERDSMHGTSSTRPAQPRRGPPQQQENGQAAAAAAAAEAAPAAEEGGDRVILTPTKLRVDSRVVMVHTTAQWLTNLFFVLFILWKVRRGRCAAACTPGERVPTTARPDSPPASRAQCAGLTRVASMPQLKGQVNWTWWTVFAPQWLNHTIHIPLQLAVLYYAVSRRGCQPCFPAGMHPPAQQPPPPPPPPAPAPAPAPMAPAPLPAQHQMVETQIGPSPPIHATPGMHLQYHLLRRTRLKSHVIDALSSLIESLAMVRARLRRQTHGLQHAAQGVARAGGVGVVGAQRRLADLHGVQGRVREGGSSALLSQA